MKSALGKSAGARPTSTLPRPRSQVLLQKMDFQSLISGLNPEILRNPLLAPPHRATLVPRRPSRHRIQRMSETESRKKELVISAPTTSRGKTHGLLSTNYSQPLSHRNYPPVQLGIEPIPREKMRVSEDSSVLIDQEQLAAVLGLDEDAKARGSESVDPRQPRTRTRIVHTALSGKRSYRLLPSCEEFVLTSVPLSLNPDRRFSRLYTDRKVASALRKTKTVSSFGTQTSDCTAKRERLDVYLPEDSYPRRDSD